MKYMAYFNPNGFMNIESGSSKAAAEIAYKEADKEGKSIKSIYRVMNDGKAIAQIDFSALEIGSCLVEKNEPSI
ncbi:MAG: hypothetical protein VB030_02810 [Eubacterium aggregans]|uniref:hypothetical protein n=1 Tax=Eubacterium aggregans TaxID=81409 RepID=UPI002B1E926B|nr:hypothetical protein [Eubacterium aggregans]MEA5073082.1 hypothetical protein [Eubacterium aggregans]